MEGKEYELRDIDDLIGLPLWKYLSDVIQGRIEIIRGELESGEEVEGDKVKRLTYEDILVRQGECKSLRYILELPIILRRIKVEDEEFNKSVGRKS